MPRASSFARLVVIVGVLGAGVAPSLAAETPKKALDPKAGGDAVYESKTADGLLYLWRGPKRYDAKKGVDVTFILHGNGGDRRWGFANHSKDSFRPDDLVISPDGTTAQGQGVDFLGEPKDAKRLHALIEEVKKAFKVRATYLYGHSQGSFFSVYYAGEFPDDVNGVVAHASGIWNWSKLGRHGHHQAIVLMHGTQDPAVPYFQSPECLPALEEAGYPIARVRTLEWWNHWPAEHNGPVPHTSQQLAWVEGMTTEDPDRLAASLEVLCDVKDKVEHDWSGLWSLSKRALAASFATDATKARAAKAIQVVEALDKRHADALAEVKPGTALEAKAWPAHLPVYLRQFDGLPACKELAGRWKEVLADHRKKAGAQMDKYWPASRKTPVDVTTAFDAGVAMIATGFLYARAQDRGLREGLVAWQKDAKKHKLSKKALKDFAAVETMIDAWKKGWEAFSDVNKTAGGV